MARSTHRRPRTESGLTDSASDSHPRPATSALARKRRSTARRKASDRKARQRERERAGQIYLGLWVDEDATAQMLQRSGLLHACSTDDPHAIAEAVQRLLTTLCALSE